MRLLDRGEATIDLADLWVAFGIGQRAVKPGAVDFALEIGAVAFGRITLGHDRATSRPPAGVPARPERGRRRPPAAGPADDRCRCARLYSRRCGSPAHAAEFCARRRATDAASAVSGWARPSPRIPSGRA